MSIRCVLCLYHPIKSTEQKALCWFNLGVNHVLETGLGGGKDGEDDPALRVEVPAVLGVSGDNGLDDELLGVAKTTAADEREHQLLGLPQGRAQVRPLVGAPQKLANRGGPWVRSVGQELSGKRVDVH